jgi:biofilm protein TabA
LPKTDYDPKKDSQFYHDSDEFPLRLNEGQFTILWPQDGHKPSCLWDKTCRVRKIVAKIRL